MLHKYFAYGYLEPKETIVQPSADQHAEENKQVDSPDNDRANEEGNHNGDKPVITKKRELKALEIATESFLGSKEPSSKVTCKCTHSKCVKLYCECFKNGLYCSVSIKLILL